MYVYAQDIIDKWKREILLEMKKKKLGVNQDKHTEHLAKNNVRTNSEFQRLYMNRDGIKMDSKESVPKNE